MAIDRSKQLRNYIEPAVSVDNKPMETDIVDPEGGEITLRHTYDNNLQGFENRDLNRHLDPRIETSAEEKPQLNEELTELYTDPESGIEFARARHTQVIYPKKVNATLAKTRGRVNYKKSDFWRTERADRNVISASNSQGITVTLQSMWPLDAPATFGDADFRAPDIEEVGNILNAMTASAHDGYSLWKDFSGQRGSNVTASAGHGGHGELLNIYSLFQGAPGVRYNWPVEEICHEGDGTPNGGSGFNYLAGSSPAAVRATWAASPLATSSICLAGTTYWDAPAQSGKRPFYYDSYDAYAADIRAKGKDYSIVPEFRISDFMSHYYESEVGQPNWEQSIGEVESANGANKGVFSLTGATYVDSLDASFYKTYSHSDFLRHFNHLNSLNVDVSDQTRYLTLRPRAMIKFLPYKGFYPVQRTIELATLFSQSYGEHVVLSGDEPNFRTFLTPLFGPGLLYNSIKSGIAVDFPVLTKNDVNTITSVSTPLLGPDGHSTANSYNSRTARGPQRSAFHGCWSGSADTVDFQYRVPFEALLLPEEHLVSGTVNKEYGRMAELRDMEPHSLLAVNSTASWEGKQSNSLYKLAMNNFLAESVDFFLEEGKLTTFSSLPDTHPQFGNAEKGKKYIMDIRISAHKSDPTTEARYMAERHLMMHAKEYYRNTAGNTKGEYAGLGIYHYDNGATAYGPACLVDTEDSVSVGAHPWAPPYASSPSFIRLTWEAPDTRKFTLDEIIPELTASHRQAYKYGFGRLAGNLSMWNSMQLTASINYKGLTSQPRVEWVNRLAHHGGQDWVPDRVIDDHTQKVWTVQTKWETPILDFSSASLNVAGRLPTMPVSGAKNVSYGMWHQYGVTASLAASSSQTKTNKAFDAGIFLELRNAKKVRWNGTFEDGSRFLLPDPTTGSADVGSLADLVGFAREAKKLGPSRQSKTVKECLVAIPYRYVDGSRKFIPLLKKPVVSYLAQGDDERLVGKYPNSAPSIKKSLDILKNDEYIYPPMLDYHANPNAWKRPYLFLTFEFSKTLSKKDVLDIWQNLPPDCAAEFEEQIAEPMTIDLSEFKQIRGRRRQPAQQYGAMKGLRWMVFKIKQRAKNNYFAKTATNADDAKFQFSFETGGRQAQRVGDGELKYSYNWPYDFFSLAELVKIEAETEFRSSESPEDPEDLREDPPPSKKAIPTPSSEVQVAASPVSPGVKKSSAAKAAVSGPEFKDKKGKLY